GAGGTAHRPPHRRGDEGGLRLLRPQRDRGGADRGGGAERGDPGVVAGAGADGGCGGVRLRWRASGGAQGARRVAAGVHGGVGAGGPGARARDPRAEQRRVVSPSGRILPSPGRAAPLTLPGPRCNPTGAGMSTRAPGSPLLVARLVWASLLVAAALYCVVLVLLLRSGAGSPSPTLGDPLRTILLVLAAGQTLAAWFVWNRFVGPSGGRTAVDPQRVIAMHVVC